MAAVGITLKGLASSGNDFYGKYLTPGTAAKNGTWDLVEAGWGPDWYPTGGKSYFLPILNGNFLPPNSSNFGFFNDPKLNTLMTQAAGRHERFGCDVAVAPGGRGGHGAGGRVSARGPERAHDPRLAGAQLRVSSVPSRAATTPTSG